MTSTRAAVYARISLTKDDDDTAGVDRQVADCEALAAEKGWTVVGTYIDNNQSAMTGARPQYRRLLRDVESGGVDVIVVWSADRLYRRLADLEELVTALGMTRVATVKSGDVDLSTADGRMLARLLGSVAQRESEKFAERMRAACEQRSRQGRLPGGERRFGYQRTHDGPWLVVPAEADAIRDAAERVLAGEPLASVARSWAAAGLTGTRGGRMGARAGGSLVRDVLLRPDLAGLSTYKGEVVARLVEHPAILTVEQHHALVALLASPTRRSQAGRPGSTLLGETCTCAVCGGRMGAWTRRTRTAKVPAYACRAGHVHRDRADLDAAVGALVVAFLTRNAARLRRPAARRKDTGKAAAEADRLRAKLAAMPALLAGDDAMDPADYAAAVRALRERLQAVESRLAATSATPVAAGLVTAVDVAAAWEAATVETRRAVVREVVDSIVVGRKPPGGRAIDAVKVTFRRAGEVAA